MGVLVKSRVPYGPPYTSIPAAGMAKKGSQISGSPEPRKSGFRV